MVRVGYDDIEFAGEPDKLKDISKLLNKNGIEGSSVVYIRWKEILPVRKRKFEIMPKITLKRLVEIPSRLGVKILIVAPTAYGKAKPEAPYEKELNWAVSGIKECGEFAANLGVNLVIEAWNRYETYWVNRLAKH